MSRIAPKRSATLTSLLASAAALLVLAASSSASLAFDRPPSPRSIKTEHEVILRGLAAYAAEGTSTAAAAQVVLDLMRPHIQKEEELVLPLLSLLPDVSEGNITADMTSAIAVADRLKAERGALFDTHAEIAAAVGELILVSEGANERELVDFAARIAVHAMGEVEVLEPAAVLVGEVLRQQLTPSQ
jgi:hypothetical protein